jgi:hypothetical protein
MHLRLTIEITPRDARLCLSRSGDGVDDDGLHQREVDHEAVVDDRAACDVVAAASDGDGEVMLLGESHGILHVGDAEAANDYGRVLVDGSVVNLSRGVVAVVAGQQDES